MHAWPSAVQVMMMETTFGYTRRRIGPILLPPHGGSEVPRKGILLGLPVTPYLVTIVHGKVVIIAVHDALKSTITD